VAALILLLGAITRWVILRRYRKPVAVVQRALHTTSWSLWMTALAGLLLAFLEYERVAISTWVIWPALYALLIIVVKIILILKYRRTVPAAITAYRATQEKTKWLEGPNKQRRAKKAARAKRRR
jgi:hypothetical protein